MIGHFASLKIWYFLRHAQTVFLIVGTLALVCRAPSQAQVTSDNQMTKVIHEIFLAKGEVGVQDYARTNPKCLSRDFILKLADIGIKERDENALTIARVLADETGDEETKADACYQSGDFYYLTSNFKNAMMYLEPALPLYERRKLTVGQGNVLKRQADILSRTGQQDKARECLEKARTFFSATNDKKGLGGVCLSQWYLLFMSGDRAGAEKVVNEALIDFDEINDAAGHGAAYRCLGFAAQMTGDNQRALDHYDKALGFYLKAGDDLGLGNIYRGEGDVYAGIGENGKALEMFAKALPYQEKVKDLRGQGYIYQSQGDVYQRMGDPEKAVELDQKASDFFERAGDLIGQGNVRTHLGEIYDSAGDMLNALQMYTKALSLFQTAKDLWGQGNALLCQADIYAERRDVARALDLYDKALPFYVQADDPRGQGNVYFGLGNVHYFSKDFESALAMYEKAFGFYVSANALPDQGNVYLRKGDIYSDEGDDQKAMAMFEKALPFFLKIEDPMAQGLVLLREAAVYVHKEEPAKAREIYDKALPLLIKTRYISGEADIDEGQAELLRREKKYPEALEFADKALGLYQRASLNDSIAFNYFLRAKILGDQQRDADAMAFYEKGLALLEKERRMAVLPTMKESLMKKAYDQYEEAAVFAIERGFPEKAFFIVEGMKARGFLDLLSEGLVDLEKDVPLELKQHRDEIENRLSMLRKRRLGEAQKEAPDEAEIASITNSVTKTEAELEDLQNHIRLRNAAYASVQYPEPVTVGELQKIIKPDEVILEYFLSKKKAYCFMTKPDVFNVVTLPAETGEIERQVKMWLLAITSSARVGERASGTPLYSSLISPAGQLINGKSLIVIPDGILARLPFETIPIATGKKMTYLLYTCPVKYVQSASVLKLLRTQYRKDGTNNSFIGFGDPVYDYESFIAGRPEKGGSLKGFKEELDIACLTRDGYTRVGGKLNRLEGSGKEVQDIAGLFREKNLVEKVNIRLDAKEEYAKADDIKNYGYIHFSAHGVLNDRFQAIALSLIPGGTEDGFLTLSDIIRCHYNARLVVLSACETGLGRAERGEGVVGLTRAVMYAGTPAAVVSLWDVSDIETTKLMTLLYSHLLKDGMSKEDALRAAKMDMQKSKNSEHPYFWGAFVMYGE